MVLWGGQHFGPMHKERDSSSHAAITTADPLGSLTSGAINTTTLSRWDDDPGNRRLHTSASVLCVGRLTERVSQLHRSSLTTFSVFQISPFLASFKWFSHHFWSLIDGNLL